MFLFAGCEKENKDPVLIVTPPDLYLIGEPLKILSFDLLYEGDVEARRLTITSKREDDFTRTELDSTISGKQFSMKFEYQVPVLYEESNIYMEFIIETADGDQVKNGRIIEVRITDFILEETAGHEMYTLSSQNMNAYDLFNGVPLYSALADSSQMHIMDKTLTNTLFPRWLSPAGILFVRYNGFDYANATNRSVKQAFNSGVKHEFVDDIMEDDIIIARFWENDADSSYCVVKVTNVIDEAGNSSDRYVFNIKK